MEKAEIENLEIDLLLNAIHRRYGFDFQNYARASVKRRIINFMTKTEYDRIIDILPQIVYDPTFFKSLISNFSITVTEMFRDPVVYKTFREKVIPFLKTYPFIKIWHAGCATGEEAYSLAIVLKEEGIYFILGEQGGEV